MSLVQFFGIPIWFCYAHLPVPEILSTLGCQLSSQSVAHHEQAWAQSCRLQTLVRRAKAGQGMWIICWAGGKWLSGISWGAGNRPGPNRSSEQGMLTGAREEGRTGYTTVLSLQLVSTIANPLDLIWSPAGGRGSNLLGQGLQSWSLKSFVPEGFWQKRSKKLSADLPKMDARLIFHGSPVFVFLISLKWKQLIVMLSSSTAFSVVFKRQFVASLNIIKAFMTALTSCN